MIIVLQSTYLSKIKYFILDKKVNHIILFLVNNFILDKQGGYNKRIPDIIQQLNRCYRFLKK